MPVTLPTINLAGTMVGSTGALDLTPVAGQAGVSYATFGQAVLRLHNESNCGLQCSLPVSGQSFYLPAGGWQDCYPKGGDNALDYEVLYVLSGPGVTLLLATYFYPGDQVPPVTQLGNSPIGGGNVSTNFSELINTGNNPASTLINVQPNDATAPTWTADNLGNLTIAGDNAGVLTQLLKLVAGASPEVTLAAASILTKIQGDLQVVGVTSTAELDVYGTLAMQSGTHVSIDNGTIISNGNGGLAVIGLALQSTQLPGTPFTVTNNATIATSDASKTVTNSGAVTGVILATPSLGDGGVFALFNNGSGSITFAASGSGVAGGSAVVVGAGNSALFVHSIVDGLWHRIVAN